MLLALMRAALGSALVLAVTAPLAPVSAETVLRRPGGTVMLNPQPLPPRWIFRPGGTVMLNPQPLPPRLTVWNRPWAWMMLNPQPLPPRR